MMDAETPADESNPVDENDIVDDQPQQDPDQPMEALNLVPDLKIENQEWLDTEAGKAVKRFDAHCDQRSEFMKRRESQLKQYAGIMSPLKYPAEGDRAPHHPLVLQSALSLWSRIWDQVCPAKGDIVHVAVVGEADEARQQMVEKHMNWQLRTKMPDWASSQGESIMQWILSGSTFREYVWDPIEKTNRIDHVPIEDMVISYAEKDTHPLMPTVPCITRVLRLAKHTMLQYKDIAFYDGVDDLYAEGAPAATGNYIEGGPVKEAAMKADGVERPDGSNAGADPDPARELLRQHVWLDIPKIGYKPVTLVVDKKSKKAVRLSIRETPDTTDQARFDREKAAYDAAMVSVTAQFSQMPAPPMGGEPAAEPMAPQIPPDQMPKAPRPVTMRPLYTVIHYRLFPNPEGFYGIGAGYLLENSNALVDEILADVLIGGRNANLQQGFISDQMAGLKGDVQAVPGKFHPIPVMPEELKNAVHQFQWNAPPPILMEMAKFLVDEAKGQTANQEVLSGEKGTSHETAKSMQIRNANAMTVVNVMTRLYIEPLKYEMKLIAHGNSVHMEAEEWFSVVEPSKTIPGAQDTKALMASRDMYLEDYHITFTADSRMTSKPERIQDAFNLANQIQQSPIVKDPQRGPALVYLAQRKIFEALELPEFAAALGPPPQPAPPPSPQSQATENSGFLNEKDHPVLPDDDHIQHLGDIEEFRMSPFAEKLSSTGKQLIDRHERAHVAALYEKTKKETDAQTQMVQPGGTGRTPTGPGAQPPAGMAGAGNSRPGAPSLPDGGFTGPAGRPS